MTQENYDYRNSPLFLRNQFFGDDRMKIPTIPKATLTHEETDGLRMIGFDRAKKGDSHYERMVHFFLYDYKFEDIWQNPDKYLESMKKYRAVLTPDFSMYLEMHPVMQLYNSFRNRWVGAYFAQQGVKVIPSVSWGDESSFDFCFSGIEKGSAVAVSTYMASAHNNHSDQKEFFLKGYNELLRRVEPATILCYNEPFPEMAGNIVFVDYDLSSWRHLHDDKDYEPSPYAKYICGAEPWPEDCAVTRKAGFVSDGVCFMKGMGRAQGGAWRPSPNKPHDGRFLGEPGEIKKTIMWDGEKRSTKIGADGRAIAERHWTDHKQPRVHSNPHDHIIDWSNGYPNFVKPHINYPNDVPEFKSYEVKNMSNPIIIPPDYNFNFESISDFKWCMRRNGEVEFVWNEKTYSIVHPIDGILIAEAYKQETEKLCNDADEVLEYLIGGVRLREIITEVKVMDRTM